MRLLSEPLLWFFVAHAAIVGGCTIVASFISSRAMLRATDNRWRQQLLGALNRKEPPQ